MQWRSLQSCISTNLLPFYPYPVIGNPDHEAPRSLIFRMFPVPDLQAHPSNLHNSTCARLSTSVPCGCVWLCVCVCACVWVTRNAIGKRRGGSVGLWCKSPPLVNTAHTDIIRGSWYRVSLCTTTCNLNALIAEVAPLEKTNLLLLLFLLLYRRQVGNCLTRQHGPNQAVIRQRHIYHGAEQQLNFRPFESRSLNAVSIYS